MRASVILVAALLLAPSPAFADVAEAKRLYKSATQHYNLAEYKDALEDFKGAYRANADPVFLFNIAQCHRQLRDYEAALTFYRSYKREAPDAPNRAEVDRLIQQMDQAVAQQRAQQPPTGTQPPGSAAGSATAGGAAPATGPSGAGTQPAESLTAPAPPPERRPLVKKPWFWASVGGAVVLVGAGVTLGVILGRPADPTASAGRVAGN